jgi:hypothetical protein
MPPLLRVLASIACAAAIALPAGCSRPRDPIEIDGGALTIRNQTPHGWTRVEVFVNDYYAGTAEAIPAGGFAHASLHDFITTYGQHFNPVNTEVRAVVVKATDDTGQPVRVAWGVPSLR